AARNSPFRGLVLSAGAWLKPLQLAWRPAAAALPAALAVLAAAGYFYTAQQAALRLLQTSALLLAVLTVGGLTRRWLLVNRCQLAREQARQRRLQLAAAEGETADAADHADETIDLAAVSEQTQKLVRTFLAAITVAGFLLIWGPLLPAVGYLGRAPLIPGVVLLTWGQALAFLAVLGATSVAARDIPALLELVILQPLPLDSGFRYAFSTLTRYVLAAVGLTIAFKILGGQWEKIQWLAAAMSVGLGFGLQEIFANFVSGIIILFERPIRVGDVITLGETTGQVNRIRMRANTIIDWDRKEYVVPNKDLVTGRLLNWTLSDHTNRLSVLVGVAYGSDTDLACQLMLDAAREQPEVLAEPAPRAFFDTFGDSSLNLKLQVFLPTLDNRWVTIHKLNSAIDRKFKEAGLEIPFPKRDLHVRFHGDAGVELAPRRTPDARPAKSDRQGAA
ncbi:MAG TPA: mechanosensitive ion channel, partial [Lacipirellulaceae bacterium]|nr:mechanosensitive ion channel [Lacipirellulaceae bacterium]